MTAPLLALNLDHRLLRDVAYDRVLEAIVSGQLAPGQLVSADELDALAETSRTPVRQAVARLVEIGLLEVQPQKHTRVAPLDGDVLARRLDMLGALYASAVEFSVDGLTADDITLLDRSLDRFVADTDCRSRGAEVTRFFTVFRECVSNATFERIRERVYPHIRRALRLHDGFDFEQGLPMMRAVRNAARDGDALAACAAAREFFGVFVPALLEGISGGDDTDTAVPLGHRRRLLRDDVHESILTAIVDGRLAPGELLHDGDLADSLGVSRAPVREAFLRLADIGLVDVLPYRHTVVNGVTLEAVDEALFIAGALTRHAALRGVPTFDDTVLDGLDELTKAAEREYEGGDLVAFGGTMQRYVSALAVPAGNAELVETLGSVSPMLQSHLRAAPDGFGSKRALAMIHRVNAASRRRDAVAVHGVIGAFHEECRKQLRRPANRK